MIFIAQTTQPISPWQMAAPIIGAVALTVGALALTLNYLNFRRNRYPSVSISGVFSSYTMDSNDFVLLFDVESYGADIHDFRAVLRCPERKLGMIDLTFAPHALPSDETKQIPNPFKNGQRLRLELTLSTSAGSDVDSIHLFAREAMLAGTAAIIVEGNGRQLGVIAHDDKKMVKQFEFYRNCANASDENGPSSPLGPPSQPLTSNPVEKISPSDAAKYIVEQLKAEIEHNRSWPTKIMAFYVTICFGLATAIVSLKGRSEKIDYSPLAAKTFALCFIGAMFVSMIITLARNQSNYFKYRTVQIAFQNQHLQGQTKRTYCLPGDWFKTSRKAWLWRFFGGHFYWIVMFFTALMSGYIILTTD